MVVHPFSSSPLAALLHNACSLPLLLLALLVLVLLLHPALLRVLVFICHLVAGVRLTSAGPLGQ